MTDPYTAPAESYPTQHQIGASSGSTTDTVKDQGSRVASDAAEGGKHVANVAADEAANVAQEAKQQARSLLDEAGSQLSTQASQQKDSLVSWLRSLADELRSMADSTRQGSGDAEGRTAQAGVATTLAERGADYAHRTASWLGDREPRAVLDEVGSFARRRPGTFLLIAAAGGVLVGRLTRGLVAGRDDDDYSGNGYAGARYAGNRYATGYADTGYADTGYADTGYADTGYADTGYASSQGYAGSTSGGQAYGVETNGGERQMVTPDVPVPPEQVTEEPLSGVGDNPVAAAPEEWPATTPVEGEPEPFESTRYPEAGR